MSQTIIDQPGGGRLLLRLTVLWLAALGFLLALGSGSAGAADLGLAASSLLAKLAIAFWPALLYLLAAIGLGRLASPVFRQAADPFLLQGGIGLALLLLLSHGLGQLGLLAGSLGVACAWAPILLGLGLLVHQARGARLEESLNSVRQTWSESIAVAIALAVLAVGATTPPGVLWRSEYGGFDALSYHLPIVQEWHALGRLAPLDHNVYSFLPSYFEGAFLHLAALTAAPQAAEPGQGMGLLAGDGWRTLSAQLLHAGLGLWTAWGVSRVVAGLFDDPQGSAARDAGAFAFALSAVVPWTLVVGSLAYNELAVTALACPALAAAADRRLSPARRGLVAGILVGAASSVKPTAFFLLGLPVATLLLCTMHPRQWARMVLAGSAAGLLMLSPWLLRNWDSCGNPVFPFASAWFGSAHWASEQVARFSAAHHESAGLLERLGFAFVRREADDQARGFLHPQWGLVWVLAGAAGVFAAWKLPRTRPWCIGLVLALGAWLSLTHVQSRFLIPLMPIAVAIIAVAGFVLLPTLMRPAAAILLLAHAGWTVALCGREGLSRAATAWPGDFSGSTLRIPASGPSRLEFFMGEIPPQLLVNLGGLPPGSKTYLLGVSTPFYYTSHVLYNVTWDRWPIVEAMRREPGEPKTAGGVWLAELREQGITHVLVDFAELARLERSGYVDPLLSPARVAELFFGRCAVVRVWGRREAPSAALFSIAGSAPAVAGAAHD